MATDPAQPLVNLEVLRLLQDMPAQIARAMRREAPSGGTRDPLTGRFLPSGVTPPTRPEETAPSRAGQPEAVAPADRNREVKRDEVGPLLSGKEQEAFEATKAWGGPLGRVVAGIEQSIARYQALERMLAAWGKVFAAAPPTEQAEKGAAAPAQENLPGQNAPGRVLAEEQTGAGRKVGATPAPATAPEQLAEEATAPQATPPVEAPPPIAPPGPPVAQGTERAEMPYGAAAAAPEPRQKVPEGEKPFPVGVTAAAPVKELAGQSVVIEAQTVTVESAQATRAATEPAAPELPYGSSGTAVGPAYQPAQPVVAEMERVAAAPERAPASRPVPAQPEAARAPLEEGRNLPDVARPIGPRVPVGGAAVASPPVGAPRVRSSDVGPGAPAGVPGYLSEPMAAGGAPEGGLEQLIDVMQELVAELKQDNAQRTREQGGQEAAEPPHRAGKRSVSVPLPHPPESGQSGTDRSGEHRKTEWFGHLVGKVLEAL